MNEKTLNECSREELLEIIKSLKKQKKFGLVWEDKPEKVATECKQKLPVVKEVVDKVIDGDSITESTNIIIEGDNYHALSVLNYTHAGKIDAIYIDPPYNTGEKARDGGFIYNDSFVDKIDSYKHSKWLSFMEKRLRLAKNLLAPNGVLFVSIDDNEQAHLKLLCDQIFNENNFLGDIIWNSTKSVTNTAIISVSHTYNLVYFKDMNYWVKNRTKFRVPAKEEGFSNPDNDPRGPWKADPFQVGGWRPNQQYEITNPNTGKVYRPNKGCSWKNDFNKFQELQKDNRIVFGKNGASGPQRKRFLSEALDRGSVIKTIWDDIGTTTNGTQLLKKMLTETVSFNNPKPVDLIKRMVDLATDKDAENTIVLDFFAGSGTTGQAVLELNKEDGGHRQFILCTNNENKIAEEVTYPRIKAVVEGYGDTEGIPANVRYFKTDFVEKDETIDKLRRKLSPACEDMIRIREDAFDKVIDEDKFKVYKNSRGLTAVIFDRFELADYIARIEELETDAPVHLYVFSYTNYGRLDELSDDLKHTYESQPIPEGVLEIYKRIFNKGGKK